MHGGGGLLQLKDGGRSHGNVQRDTAHIYKLTLIHEYVEGRHLVVRALYLLREGRVGGCVSEVEQEETRGGGGEEQRSVLKKEPVGRCENEVKGIIGVGGKELGKDQPCQLAPRLTPRVRRGRV